MEFDAGRKISIWCFLNGVFLLACHPYVAITSPLKRQSYFGAQCGPAAKQEMFNNVVSFISLPFLIYIYISYSYILLPIVVSVPTFCIHVFHLFVYTIPLDQSQSLYNWPHYVYSSAGPFRALSIVAAEVHGHRTWTTSNQRVQVGCNPPVGF
jgi:hypothetical protein